ncbi:hypothetical protein D3C76_410630 [compost metagenome]
MSNWPTALVVELRNNRFGKEEQLLIDAAERKGIIVLPMTEKKLSRNQFAFHQGHLVAGGVQFIRHALRSYGKELPPEDSYPECLYHLLHRKVAKMTSLRAAKNLIEDVGTHFVKPASLKRFTGFVTCDSMDPRFNGASDSMPCWVAEPVQFVSEWRCYVAYGVLEDIRFADHGGDRNIKPDRGVIIDAIRDLTECGAPAGYAVDFGVLSTGQTALVELNDGFSIGAYDGIEAETYWNVIAARWDELIS